MGTRDIYGGAGLIGFAGAYALAASGLSMTSSLGIGSGLFPMVLAVILAVIGFIILVQGALSRTAAVAPAAPLPWRAIILIVAAPIVFGFMIEPLGLVPSLFAATFLAALANRGTTLLGAAALAACLVLFSVALFVWGLGLPLALLGSWLPFGG
jgi:putative tricarboxylic transport membrane protein